MTAKAYNYRSRPTSSNLVIAEWTFDAFQDCETTVLPDGCRDIIVETNEGQADTWFVSDLSRSAYRVPTPSGAHIQGMRLHPGVEIREHDLSSWLNGRSPTELFGTDQFDEFCSQSEGVTVALECLASGQRSVHCVAKQLGVSQRTLERHVKSGTGETPYFWFSLARARKAGLSLVSASNLSDAAYDAGFADQSHMNREMKKWFGCTPNQLKENTELLSVLTELGYG